MIIRSRILIASLLAPALVVPAFASPVPRDLPAQVEVEDWELEPDFEVAAPSEEELDRLVREGGTLRVVIDGVVYEEAIPAPTGKALTRGELALLERDVLHQERLVAFLEQAPRDPATAEQKLVEYARRHSADLRAVVAARPGLLQRLLNDEAALLSLPDTWLERLGAAFSRSVTLITGAGAWLDRGPVLEALQAFTATGAGSPR